MVGSVIEVHVLDLNQDFIISLMWSVLLIHMRLLKSHSGMHLSMSN